MALTIPPYAGQGWTDNSSPDLSSETLNAVDAAIAKSTDAINAIANALVSQIINDPNKFASMAALFAVNQKVETLNSNLLQYAKRTAILTIVLPSAEGWSDYTAWPSGFTNSNAVLEGMEVVTSDGTRSVPSSASYTRTFAQRDSSGVKMYTNDSNYYGKIAHVTVTTTSW